MSPSSSLPSPALRYLCESLQRKTRDRHRQLYGRELYNLLQAALALANGGQQARHTAEVARLYAEVIAAYKQRGETVAAERGQEVYSAEGLYKATRRLCSPLTIVRA